MSDGIIRSVEQVMYSSYVKHNRLQEIVYRTFSNSSIATATQLNVFIDLYSVMKTIFSEHGHTDLSLGNYTDLTTCLVNMCAHYRTFFKSLGVHTRFFMVFSFNIGEYYYKFCKDYNIAFKQKLEVKTFREMAKANFQLLELICPYLPDIHFVYSEKCFETTTVIAYLINKLNDPNPNLIISKDLYPLQLCANFPNTSYLYPIKKHDGDFSLMVSINEKSEQFRKDFWDLFSYVRKIENPERFYGLSPLNFPILNAINRFPERCLNVLTNINVATNSLIRMSNSKDVKLTIDTMLMQNIISEALIRKAEPRLYCLDYTYAYPYYANSPEVLKINLDNLPDNGQLENINAKYFANNPMKLLYL